VTSGARAKKAIAGIYSWAADTLYEPVVVKRAFPLLGGNLNDLVLAQGRRALEVAGGRPILDMPVGTAYFTIETARRHPGVVVGADLAGGMVRAARRTAETAGATSLSCVQADAHRLPFAGGTFGAVLCTNGLQVIPGLRQTMAELARVLAPGGALLLSVVTLPVTAALPAGAARHVPTVLKSRRDILEAVRDAGLTVTSSSTQRFALLAEALKPGERTG
jgi:ubiquinone/menaquinone biosynthesis C-methylase UbiE